MHHYRRRESKCNTSLIATEFSLYFLKNIYATNIFICCNYRDCLNIFNSCVSGPDCMILHLHSALENSKRFKTNIESLLTLCSTVGQAMDPGELQRKSDYKATSASVGRKRRSSISQDISFPQPHFKKSYQEGTDYSNHMKSNRLHFPKPQLIAKIIFQISILQI